MDTAQRVTPRPFFFSSHGRPLYGMFCAGEPRRADAPALVACHSVGLEHNVGCRVLAQGVRKAANLGYPALLYHSRGHGDSAGDFADVTFESLVEDALSAANWVCEQSGAQRVIWLGLRFGCLVAAEAASRRQDTVAVALWEPVHHGIDYCRQFVRTLMFSVVARGGQPRATPGELLERVEREGRVDIRACYFDLKFYRSARDVDLMKILEGWSGPTFLAQIQPRLNLIPDNVALVSAIEGRAAKVSVTRIREEPGWQFPGTPWTSAALLDDTGAWLDALA